MMDWGELGTELAKIGLPLLGAVLPVPGGAEIGAAIASHIGSPTSKPEDIFATITASSDALMKAKQFEATHQETMLKLVLEARTAAIQAEGADRASARDMATKTGAKTPGILSWTIIAGAFCLYGWLIYSGNTSHLDDLILGRLLGTIDMAFGTVLAYWLGTSFSSRSKDETISALSK